MVSFWPTTIRLTFLILFATAIAVTVVWYFAAILPSVSPRTTV